MRYPRLLHRRMPMLFAIALAGCGPTLSAPDTPIAFGDVLVGSSKSESMTMTRSGTGDVLVADVRVSGGDEADFSVSVPGARPITVAAGGSLTATVTLTPDRTGAFETELSAQVVTGTADGFPLAARGNGVNQVETGAIRIAFPGDGLEFGNVPVQTSKLMAVMLVNFGPNDWVGRVSSPAAGSPFLQGMGPAFPFPKNTTMAIPVAFTPPAAQPYVDALVIAVGGGFVGVTLSGTGVAGEGEGD